MPFPLLLEHGKHRVLEPIQCTVGASGLLGRVTASVLSPGQYRVQKCAAGVGVDFDQLRPVLAQVKVVAHERPDGAWIKTGDVRRPGQSFFLIGRKLGCGFDRLNNPLHRRDVSLGNKNRRV